MDKPNWITYGLSGAAAGIINGLFGAGGGMVLVPLLIKAGKLEDKKAFATAICIILPLCVVSIIIYATRGVVSVSMALPYLIGGLLGGILGGILFQKVSVKLLHRLFGILILWGGFRLLR